MTQQPGWQEAAYIREDVLREPYDRKFLKMAVLDGRYVQGAVTVSYQEEMLPLLEEGRNAYYVLLARRLAGSTLLDIVKVRLVGSEGDELWVEVTGDAPRLVAAFPVPWVTGVAPDEGDEQPGHGALPWRVMLFDCRYDPCLFLEQREAHSEEEARGGGAVLADSGKKGTMAVVYHGATGRVVAQGYRSVAGEGALLLYTGAGVSSPRGNERLFEAEESVVDAAHIVSHREARLAAQ